MKQVIDVESYEIDTDSIVHDNIDQVLHSNELFRLDAFSYIVGDCLFDAFQVLLNFHYSSTDLRNGLIYHFLDYLESGNVEALDSYQYELASNFLCQLYGIHYVTTYFSKMWLSTSATLHAYQRGLWGDTFCIRWFSKWLNISIGIWLLTRKTSYLLFNIIASCSMMPILSVVIMNHYSIENYPYAILEDLIFTCHSFAETFNHIGNKLCIIYTPMDCTWRQLLHLAVEIVCSMQLLFGSNKVRCALVAPLHCANLLQCNYRWQSIGF
jgi:hypothetical protein